MDRRWVAGGVVIALVVLVVAVRTLSGGGDDEPLKSRGALVAAGDCVDLPVDDSLLEPMDCGDPHDAQVFAEFDLEGEAYPGDATVRDRADQGCVDRWQSAVGTNYFTDTTFDYVSIAPDEDRWTDGVREVTCLLVTGDGSPMIRDQLGF